MILQYIMSGVITIFLIWLIVNSFKYNKLYAAIFWKDNDVTYYGPFENESYLEDWKDDVYLNNGDNIIKIKVYFDKNNKTNYDNVQKPLI